MPSVFGHALSAIGFGSVLSTRTEKVKFYVLAIACAALPDADMIMFKFGIPYHHWLGHRGFFHSLVFALILALVVKGVFYAKTKLFSPTGIYLILVFFLVTASHGVLDAMTTGGRGIAFFSPFDNTRHFLPWRFIQVSPLSAGDFFGAWGLAVLKSEAIYIGIPMLAVLIFSKYFHNRHF